MRAELPRNTRERREPSQTLHRCGWTRAAPQKRSQSSHRSVQRALTAAQATVAKVRQRAHIHDEQAMHTMQRQLVARPVAQVHRILGARGRQAQSCVTAQAASGQMKLLHQPGSERRTSTPLDGLLAGLPLDVETPATRARSTVTRRPSWPLAALAERQFAHLCSALMATGHGGLRRPWLVSARTPFERALLLNAFEFLDDQDRF